MARTASTTTAPVEAPEVTAPAPEVKPRAKQKLVWKDLEDKVDGQAPAIGVRNGNVYEILRNEDGSWSATHQFEEGDITTLVDNAPTGHVAWRKCVDHHNGAYVAPVVEPVVEAASA